MSGKNSVRVTINIDGGARGNPGPAGAGVVIRASDDGTILHSAGWFLGRATNNVAEYSALLEGLRAAASLGASEIECFSDSELLVRQINGEYRVRNERLGELFSEAQRLREQFEGFSIRHIPREQNAEADHLVNRAINLRKNVEDAASE